MSCTSGSCTEPKALVQLLLVKIFISKFIFTRLACCILALWLSGWSDRAQGFSPWIYFQQAQRRMDCL